MKEATMFYAAGKPYASKEELAAKRDENPNIVYDCYGRRLLYVWERFPCFDSYDRLYEKRCFRTYFIETDQGWTVVATQDDSDKVEVYENLSADQAGKKAGYWLKDIAKWLK